MQNYNNFQENLDRIDEVSGYMLLKLNLNQVETMSKCAIQQNQQHLQHLVEHADRDQWYVAFGSDVAANVLTTSAFWLLGKLFAKR